MSAYIVFSKIGREIKRGFCPQESINLQVTSDTDVVMPVEPDMISENSSYILVGGNVEKAPSMDLRLSVNKIGNIPINTLAMIDDGKDVTEVIVNDGLLEFTSDTFSNIVVTLDNIMYNPETVSVEVEP